MFPGRFDRLSFALQVLGLLVTTAFLVVTSIVFFEHFAVVWTEHHASLADLWRVLGDLWEPIKTDGLAWAGFVFATLISIGTLVRMLAASKREQQLRSAFGAGLWYGYQRNFLERVVRSFQQRNIQPIIILGSPSRNIAENAGATEFVRGLEEPLRQRGYELRSLSGADAPSWFRQVFAIRRVGESGQEVSQPAARQIDFFFDVPSTLIAFEGAIRKIVDIRRMHIDEEQKDIYFQELKDDFFAAMQKWAVDTGYARYVVKLEFRSEDVQAAAATLAGVIDRAMAPRPAA